MCFYFLLLVLAAYIDAGAERCRGALEFRLCLIDGKACGFLWLTAFEARLLEAAEAVGYWYLR